MKIAISILDIIIVIWLCCPFESTGLPALVVSISLGIAAGTGPGIKSYVSEKL